VGRVADDELENKVLDLLPYGTSVTRRLTVPAAEAALYQPQPCLDLGFVRLVDYMGGDAAIEHAATQGRGRAVYGGPALPEFFDALRTQGMQHPFRFAELKFHIKCPIDAALDIVPCERASVNEYSGRYSVMTDDHYLPSEEDLDGYRKRDGTSFTPEEKRRVTSILKDVYWNALAAYHELVREDGLDFTRELARSILPLANYTEFYWKVSLEDLLRSLDGMQARRPSLAPFAGQLRALAAAVAPEAVASYGRVEHERKLSARPLRLDTEAFRTYTPSKESPYGTSETRRLTVPAAETLLFKPVPVLEHGYVRPTDYMGSDDSIVQAARVSYGKGTRKGSKDEALIRYLDRHWHTTPGEMIEFAWEALAPWMVVRQWIRHRMHDKSRDLLATVGTPYLPQEGKLCKQSRENRQGRGQELSADEKEQVKKLVGGNYERQMMAMRELREMGAPSDLERLAGGVGFFVPWCAKTDRKNMMDYVRLRKDNHAQWEIQEYARAKAEFVKAVAPAAYRSSLDYRLEALTLSRMETAALADIIAGTPVQDACQKHGLKGREQQEFYGKLARLNVPTAK
jgi:thymidylate synthase (FAD)